MRRTFAAAALAASLAAPLSAGPFDRLWSFLFNLWEAAPAASEPVTNVKLGCGSDPDGQCKAEPQPQTFRSCGGSSGSPCQPGS